MIQENIHPADIDGVLTMEKILRSLPCALFSMDHNGYCLSANQYQAKMLGLSHEREIIGKNIYDFVHISTEADLIRETDKRVMLEQTTITAEESATIGKNKKETYLVTKSPLQDENGKLLGVMGSAIHISAFKRNIFSHDLTHLSVNTQKNNSKNDLTPREVECIKHMIKGKSAPEIAKILKISKRTVDTHINNIKCKLNCHKQFQLGYLIGKYG